jgi:hypothetical protein
MAWMEIVDSMAKVEDMLALYENELVLELTVIKRQSAAPASLNQVTVEAQQMITEPLLMSVDPIGVTHISDNEEAVYSVPDDFCDVLSSHVMQEYVPGEQYDASSSAPTTAGTAPTGPSPTAAPRSPSTTPTAPTGPSPTATPSASSTAAPRASSTAPRAPSTAPTAPTGPSPTAAPSASSTAATASAPRAPRASFTAPRAPRPPKATSTATTASRAPRATSTAATTSAPAPPVGHRPFTTPRDASGIRTGSMKWSEQAGWKATLMQARLLPTKGRKVKRRMTTCQNVRLCQHPRMLGYVVFACPVMFSCLRQYVCRL